MASGIFHVDFRAGTGDYGDGLVVVKDGSVNGGDLTFCIKGKYLLNQARLILSSL